MEIKATRNFKLSKITSKFKREQNFTPNANVDREELRNVIGPAD